jgi:hypothetical protein
MGKSSSSNNAANQQLIIHAGLALEMLPINQMGEGLLNIAQAYLEEDDDEDVEMLSWMIMCNKCKQRIRLVKIISMTFSCWRM